MSLAAAFAETGLSGLHRLVDASGTDVFRARKTRTGFLDVPDLAVIHPEDRSGRVGISGGLRRCLWSRGTGS